MALTQAQIEQFKIDGYLHLKQVVEPEHCQQLRALTTTHLDQRVAPFELEAEVRYPGSPESTSAPGGDTIRRLLLADRRDPAFLEMAKLELTTRGIQQILQSEELWLNPNHHNCIMTKMPSYSSETQWHRDTRYWNFSDKYLVNAWFALGDELCENGAMKVLPGSHRWKMQDDALDEAQFLIQDHPYNKERLSTARTVELKQGDALLFSAHCFHAAGRNTTGKPKYSLVFTYHGESTTGLEGTRSRILDPVRVI